jgi:hypothetical protein
LLSWRGQLADDAHAEELAEMESAERSLNRLLRTHCSLAEALDRHRHGDRHIAVQQVSIAEGAQAILGDVHQNGAKARRNTNCHANGRKPARELSDSAHGAKVAGNLNGHASA